MYQDGVLFRSGIVFQFNKLVTSDSTCQLHSTQPVGSAGTHVKFLCHATIDQIGVEF